MRPSGDLYRDQINSVFYRFDRSHQYQFLLSAVRSVLQTASMTLLEYCTNFVIDVEDSRLPGMAERMLRPSDGIFEQVISEGSALARNNGWRAAEAWTSGGEGKALRKRVQDWSAHRNKHPGHGIVSMSVVEEALIWLPTLAVDLVDGLESFLPTIDPTGTAYLPIGPSSQQQLFELKTIRMPTGQPTVIREIVQRGDCWRFRYQTLDASESTEGTYDVAGDPGILGLLRQEVRRFRQYEVPVAGATWRPTVLLHKKQTTIFEGRTEQLRELRDWFDDVGSRACNVYGEGGIGKTTLTLQFLNSILEAEADAPEWRPEVICFFTAKQTRWGPDGLQMLHGTVPPVEDAVRELVYCNEDRIEPSLYELPVEKLIGKVAGNLRDLGLQRDDILLVLDNTETLASSAADEERLARVINSIARHVARVLITSRRREQLEAYPIRVPGLSETEGVALLERLGEEYDAKPLRQTGRPGKRKLVTRFSGRPLLLDVFARLVGRYQYSLDSATNAVLRLASDDLGTFLYDDVWARLDAEERNAFLTIGQLGDTVSGKLVEFVCSELQIQHSLLLDTYEKTRFGARHDYSTSYDLVIEPSARAFLSKKYKDCSAPQRSIIGTAISGAERRHRAILRAHESIVTDRVAKAFRSDAAKAAKLAAVRGEYQDAIFWYEEAIRVDTGNAALLDRFAFFLATKGRDLDRAYTVSRHACELDPNDPDSHFTAGHIAASRGETAQADSFLARAQELDFPPHRCALQKVKARVVEVENALRSGHRSSAGDLFARYKNEIEALLQGAIIKIPQGALDIKHMGERRRIQNRITELMRIIR